MLAGDRSRRRQAAEQEHFDRLADSSGEIWWGSTTPAGVTRLQRRAVLMSQRLVPLDNPLVLELGCGVGALTKCLLDETPLMRLVSCDVSSKSVKIAAGRCREYKHVHFGVSDVTSMPSPAQVFDAVIGNSVLHHLSLTPSLREVWRVLRPGGLIFFFEPNMLNPQVAIEKNVRVIGERLQNSPDETAFFRWPLRRLLCTVGFRDVLVQPFDFLHPGTPARFINVVDRFGQLLEHTPFIKEISGSLLIQARKPGSA